MTWLDLSCAPNKHNTFDRSPCDGTMLSALEVTLHLISLAILNGSYCYSPHVTGEEQELRGAESFAKGVKSRLSTWAWACLCLTNLWIIVHLWQRALTWMGFFRKDLEATFPVRWNACSPLPPYSFCPSLLRFFRQISRPDGAVRVRGHALSMVPCTSLSMGLLWLLLSN